MLANLALMFLVVWKFYPGELCATVQFPSLLWLEQRLMKLGHGKYFSGLQIKTESHESAVPWEVDEMSVSIHAKCQHV